MKSYINNINQYNNISTNFLKLIQIFQVYIHSLQVKKPYSVADLCA